MVYKKPSAPPSQRCADCGRGWALYEPDPDGVRRCIGHSKGKFAKNAQRIAATEGALAGEKMRGVADEFKKAAVNGQIDPEFARKLKEAKDRNGVNAAEEMKLILEQNARAAAAKPVELDSKEKVLSFLARAAARLEAGMDPKDATAAAALARTALTALGVEAPDLDNDEAPRGFSYETTSGDAVPVKPRDEKAGDDDLVQ